jgi:MinD-like ATPase involved in chromosome partitioning or flagellar assembly
MQDINFDKRINIFTGHYGSGKSEISVNAAVSIKKAGHDVLMADMDIVNPFFRSFDAKNTLESLGIKVIAPMYANTNVDVPVVGPEVSAALRNKARHVILDVGGDEEGARVLGCYHAEIQAGDYDMFLVFNRARPMTQNLSDTLKYIREIEEASRLKVTKLINNTHYLDETSIEDVLYGLELAREISSEINVPIAATCVMEGLENKLAEKLDHPVYVIRKNILLSF